MGFMSRILLCRYTSSWCLLGSFLIGINRIKCQNHEGSSWDGYAPRRCNEALKKYGAQDQRWNISLKQHINSGQDAGGKACKVGLKNAGKVRSNYVPTVH